MTVSITCKVCLITIKVPNYRTKMCEICSRNKRLLRCKTYKESNKEQVQEYNKKWKSKNKETVSEYNRQYAIDNHDCIRKRKTLNERHRRHTDPVYKLQILTRNRFRKFYIGDHTSNDCVGISFDEFVKWIESQFTGDMNWGNHGTLWHIDHVVPCHSFNFELEQDRNTCFHWSNTRPLLAKINIKRMKCSIYELLCQEIRVKFYNPYTNFEPLVTKFVEKSSNG